MRSCPIMRRLKLNQFHDLSCAVPLPNCALTANCTQSPTQYILQQSRMTTVLAKCGEIAPTCRYLNFPILWLMQQDDHSNVDILGNKSFMSLVLHHKGPALAVGNLEE
ncbi:hypothetical protein BGZ60DRAFT_25978 [Tricladium varicosporioides]|nr:hypothetical protein BGZ60DRAFT_25978 [Hymenoscyphus varicosporioides]